MFFISFSDAGIHSRIELAMDLVKKHLTSAVKDEIQYLRAQINTLNDKCSRLEDENRILKQNATPDVLMLINDRSSVSQQITPIQQQHQQQQQQQQQQQLLTTALNQTLSTNFSSTKSSNTTSSAMFSPSALSATDTNLNISGDDNELITTISSSSSTNNNNNNCNTNENNSESINNIKLEESLNFTLSNPSIKD